MRYAEELRQQVVASLDGLDGTWDVDAIVADIDTESIEDLAPEVYWRIVGRHEIIETDPAADFVSELSAAITKQRADRPAYWTDGVVTVHARGVSRVNQSLPQPAAQFTVTTPLGQTVIPESLETDDWEQLTWESVWQVVKDAREDADAVAGQGRTRVRDTVIALKAAEVAVSKAREARDEAIRDAAAAGVSAVDLAGLAGLSEPGVYKITRG